MLIRRVRRAGYRFCRYLPARRVIPAAQATLYFTADARRSRLVVREPGERHEAYALIAVLLEKRDLFPVRSTGRVTGKQRA